MTDDDRGAKRSGCVVASIAASLLVLPLYALSVGPAYWLMERGWISSGVVDWFYAPLVYAADQCGATTLFIRYVNWWLKFF